MQANPIASGVMGGFVGYIHLLLGNKIEAQRMVNQSLESALEYVHQSSEYSDYHFVLEGKAQLELMDGRAERAAPLFGAAWTLREKYDYPLAEFERPDYEAAIAEARSALGDAAFDQAFADGQTMTMEQAIQFALDDQEQ